MAKAAEKSEEKSVALATAKGMTASVPDFLKGYDGATGTEGIESTDVSIPRLKLGQGLTPEVKDKLVNDGDMFHSITKEVIVPRGEAGRFIPIAYTKEWILWNDILNGGGIFDRAQKTLVNGEVKYRWLNPNQEYKNKVKGVVAVTWRTKEFIEEDGLGKFGSSIPGDKESPPAATEHFNYIVCLPDFGYQLVALSFSRTAAKKARDLNAMLKMSNTPMFARVFKISAVPDQNDSGQEYYNYGIIPDGFVQTEEEFTLMRNLFEEFSKKSFQVDFSEEAAADSKTEAERQEGF